MEKIEEEKTYKKVKINGIFILKNSQQNNCYKMKIQ